MAFVNILFYGLAISFIGLFFVLGVVFLRSATKASAARERHATQLSASFSQTLIGDKTDSPVPGREEAFQEGISYDRKTKGLVSQRKLSNDYIDSLIG